MTDLLKLEYLNESQQQVLKYVLFCHLLREEGLNDYHNLARKTPYKWDGRSGQALIRAGIITGRSYRRIVPEYITAVVDEYGPIVRPWVLWLGQLKRFQDGFKEVIINDYALILTRALDQVCPQWSQRYIELADLGLVSSTPESEEFRQIERCLDFSFNGQKAIVWIAQYCDRSRLLVTEDGIKLIPGSPNLSDVSAVEQFGISLRKHFDMAQSVLRPYIDLTPSYPEPPEVV